jgi:hypothetical protein
LYQRSSPPPGVVGKLREVFVWPFFTRLGSGCQGEKIETS